MSANQYFDTLEEQIERSDRVVKHAGCSVPTNLARKMNRSQKEKYMMKCLQKLSGMELLRYSRKYFTVSAFGKNSGNFIR